MDIDRKAPKTGGDVTASSGTAPQTPITSPTPSIAERILAPLRAVGRFIDRRALARATYAVPRTARLISSMLAHGEVADDLPAPSPSLGFAAQVAMDEALLAVAMTPNRFPLPSDYRRVSHELEDARRLYVRRGWMKRPRGVPPPATDA